MVKKNESQKKIVKAGVKKKAPLKTKVVTKKARKASNPEQEKGIIENSAPVEQKAPVSEELVAGVSLQSSRKFWLYFLGAGLIVLLAIQSYGYLTGWGNPQKVIERHFDNAQRMTLAKRYSSAIKEYDKILSMSSVGDETKRQAMVGMADLYRDMKEWKKAIEMYRELREKEAGSVMSAWSGLKIAECQVESGQAKQGLDTYQGIIDAFPGSDWDAEARLGQGKAYEAMKEYDKAIENYRSLEKDYHGGFLAADALIQIGRCYEKQGNREKAIATYEHIINNYPETMGDEAKNRLRRMKSGKAPQGIRDWE